MTDEERGQPRRLHGLQYWVALPPATHSCAIVTSGMTLLANTH